MWNDYANHHNGFCQEIEIIDGDEFFPIIYTDDLFKDYTDELKNILEKQKYGQKLTGNDYKPLILSNKTKSLNYKYEKEIRIFHNPFCEGHPILLNDTVYENKKRKLSYIGEPFTIESKGGKIINTIIGKACSEEIKEKIIQICDENRQDYEIE